MWREWKHVWASPAYHAVSERNKKNRQGPKKGGCMKHNYGSRGAADRSEAYRAFLCRGPKRGFINPFTICSVKAIRTRERANSPRTEKFKRSTYHQEVDHRSQLDLAAAAEASYIDAFVVTAGGVVVVIYRESEQFPKYTCLRSSGQYLLSPRGIVRSRIFRRRSKISNSSFSKRISSWRRQRRFRRLSSGYFVVK